MANDTDAPPTGPLRIPLSPGSRVVVRRALTEKLKGHTTSADWLPAGLSPELDELRSEMLRLRRVAAADIEALRDLLNRYRQEDLKHESALERAYRKGTATIPEDLRTPQQDRDAARANVQERIDAAVLVMADLADNVITTMQQHEQELLSHLRGQLTTAQEKRREADRLVAEAKTEEWRIHRLGQWIMNTAGDGPFGRQPAPIVEQPPARFNPAMLRTSLERPWHRPLTPRPAAAA